MSSYTTAFKPRRIGRVSISQEALLDWLDFKDAVIVDVRMSPRSPHYIVEFCIEHEDMPDVPVGELIPDVALTHSVSYHEYHDKPVRTSPKRED